MTKLKADVLATLYTRQRPKGSLRCTAAAPVLVLRIFVFPDLSLHACMLCRDWKASLFRWDGRLQLHVLRCACMQAHTTYLGLQFRIHWRFHVAILRTIQTGSVRCKCMYSISGAVSRLDRWRAVHRTITCNSMSRELNVCMLKTLLASHCFQTSRSKASLRICKRSGMHFELMRAGSNRDGIEGILIDNCRKSP